MVVVFHLRAANALVVMPVSGVSSAAMQSEKTAVRVSVVSGRGTPFPAVRRVHHRR